MKPAIYLRKSVDRDRDERSVSIDSQKAEIAALPTRAGYGPGAERIQRALKILAEGMATGILERRLRSRADCAGRDRR